MTSLDNNQDAIQKKSNKTPKTPKNPFALYVFLHKQLQQQKLTKFSLSLSSDFSVLDFFSPYLAHV